MKVIFVPCKALVTGYIQSIKKSKHNSISSDLAGAGTPQINTGSQADTEQVTRRPVYQVEVEVILQLWSIQHFEGDLGDLSGWFPRGAEQLVTTKKSKRNGDS